MRAVEFTKQSGVESDNNNPIAQKIFFARSRIAPKAWSYDHVGFITQDGKQIQMSGHKGNEVYVTNTVTDDPEFPEQNIKVVSLPKSVSVPTTNTVNAENCGTFVANVLQANGIKGFDTQKLYSVMKTPRQQGVAEGSEQSLSSMVNQDQAERNEYANFVKSQAGGDWDKGAKMYAQLKKRSSNDVFGDAARLNQFMKMKFDFDKFTDEDWDNYWLLAQHCDTNRDFQKKALSIIKKYQGTDHSHYKYLYDRISMGLTGKQKYGTQNVKEQDVAEGKVTETTEQFYNLVEWKKAAKKLKMFITVGYMAGTKGVKIYEAQTEDELSGGRFFAGPGWNYGHITTVKNNVDEMALQTYKTMGDFSKPGPFTGADKKLVPHPKNIEKATRFFEQTPFDFRLFFSHLKGTGKYNEHGVMSPDQIRQVFGQDAEEIINGSENAITIVFVGNKGDAKVMLTPWMMAHRFGHAIQASGQPLAKEKILSNWNAWLDTSNLFFTSVNNMLEEYYSKTNAARHRDQLDYRLTPEYNALFNAIGTQRSSRSGQIRRPYEFLYELFAQYLGTGKVTLNPLPTNLTYGRKAWGNPTKYMNIKSEYRNETDRKYASEILERDMELMFNDVLSSSVGKIYVM